jgi:hypothetical protein
MKRLIVLVKYLIVLGCLSCSAYAQDTLQLTLKDAEQLFLQHNISLIAEKYNVDISQALKRQAKLWDNPTFSVSTNIYDGSKYPFYHGTSNNGGEADIQWQQLFRIGGQRKKLLLTLQDNTRIAEEQFNELMNSLRFTLHTDFYTLSSLLEEKKMYEAQLVQFDPLVTGILLCMVFNVACDFSAFNYSSGLKDETIDLDNTYLECFLESVFHVNIKVAGQNTASHSSSSAFLFKICSVVAFQQIPSALPPSPVNSRNNNFITFHEYIYPQSFLEINSPPPKA